MRQEGRQERFRPGPRQHTPGERIYMARQTFGLSLEELGEALGVARGTLSEIETGAVPVEMEWAEGVIVKARELADSRNSVPA